MAEGTKKLIAKSKAWYRGILIMELGANRYAVVIGKNTYDDIVSLSEAKAFIDSYYLQKKYVWN